MQLSQQGLDFLKRRESLRLESYPDIAGVWTIGYGTIRIKGRAVTRGMKCTLQQAEEYLLDDCREFIEVVNDATANRTLSQNEFDSLVSFTYNVGSGGFLSSSLCRAVRFGTPVVEDLFTRWCKVRDPRTKQLVVSRGLFNRRVMEWQMYSQGVYAR